MTPNKTEPSKGKICVSIAKDNTEEALRAALAAQSSADVIEIRLDSLDNSDTTPFTKQITSPLLFTNRPQWEGGLYSGTEKERITPLLQAIDQDAAYVDIELQSEEKTRETILAATRHRQTKIIVSWHDFKHTPDRESLQQIFNRQLTSGAHIGKMVSMAHDFTDVLRMLQLQELAYENNFPLCAFCMGRPGMISRLATLELGGYMTYAAANAGEATAPGQLTAAVLIECMKSFTNEY